MNASSLPLWLSEDITWPLLWGILPTAQAVSWEGHLAGLLVGLYLASREKPMEAVKVGAQKNP